MASWGSKEMKNPIPQQHSRPNQKKKRYLPPMSKGNGGAGITVKVSACSTYTSSTKGICRTAYPGCNTGDSCQCEIPHSSLDEHRERNTQRHWADVHHLPILGRILPRSRDLHIWICDLVYQCLLRLAATSRPIYRI